MQGYQELGDGSGSMDADVSLIRDGDLWKKLEIACRDKNCSMLKVLYQGMR